MYQRIVCSQAWSHIIETRDLSSLKFGAGNFTLYLLTSIEINHGTHTVYNYNVYLQ